MPWRSRMEVAYVGSHNENLGSYNNSSYNSASDLNVICGIEKGCASNPNPADPTDNLFTVNLGLLPSSLTTTQGVSGGISSMDTPELGLLPPVIPSTSTFTSSKHNFYSNYNQLPGEVGKAHGHGDVRGKLHFREEPGNCLFVQQHHSRSVNLRNDYNPVPFDRTQVFNIYYLVDIGKRYKGTAGFFRSLSTDGRSPECRRWKAVFPLASEQGENFGFGYGSVLPVQTEYQNQSNPQSNSTCETTYGIPRTRRASRFA